jgi:TRAP-type mannitol/chloroaromatic compound transport system permease large subunit
MAAAAATRAQFGTPEIISSVNQLSVTTGVVAAGVVAADVVAAGVVAADVVAAGVVAAGVVAAGVAATVKVIVPDARPPTVQASYQDPI